MSKMQSTFTIQGQLGKVHKKDTCYLVNIAQNIYEKGDKIDTIWYNCICSYKPNAKTGDSVIATGTFESSKNPNYPFTMKIINIGVKSEHKSDFDENYDEDES